MTRQVNSVYHGTERLSFLGPKIWEQVPQEIKESANIAIFKSKIKNGHLHIVRVDYAVLIFHK